MLVAREIKTRNNSIPFDQIATTPLAGLVGGEPFEVVSVIPHSDTFVSVYDMEMTKELDRQTFHRKLLVTLRKDAGEQKEVSVTFIKLEDGKPYNMLTQGRAIVSEQGDRVHVALWSKYNDKNMVNGVFE